MEHSRQRDVHGVADASCRARQPILAGGRPADDGQVGVVGPRLDVVILVDEHPDVLEAPFHLALRLDEARHSVSCPEAWRMARSIFG